MALLIRVSIEESKKELNVIIWNDEDQQIKSTKDPVVNLKIPLKSSNEEISVSENIWNGLCSKETSLKEVHKLHNEVAETSETKNEKNFMKINSTENLVTSNEDISTIEKPTGLNSTQSVDDVMMENVSSTFEENGNLSENTIDECISNDSSENNGEDLSFSSYLKYIRKKSEAFQKEQEHKNCVVRDDVEQTKVLLRTEISNKEKMSEPRKEAASRNTTDGDTASVASDDYSLMIDDEPIEKDLSRTAEKLSLLLKEKPKPRFRCQFCDRVFPTKSGHRQHMSIVHELKFACTICNLTFPLRRQLLLHFRIHGPKTAPKAKVLYPCLKCGRKFKCPNALKNHSKSHNPVQTRFYWRVSNFKVDLPEKAKTKTAVHVQGTKSTLV